MHLSLSRAHGVAMGAFQIQSGTLPTLKLDGRVGQLRCTLGDGEPFHHTKIAVCIRQLVNE